ncbi:ANTAR domain-containing protein [Streptomyces sp. W16]|uniref:ANTAR domain-containing protein n=1 Tax=Streptomyces sp. W16 TaxID=3076631 RepID=UPI002E0E0366
MHQLTTPREEQPLPTAVTSTGNPVLAIEIPQLRARDEQLERALVSRAAIDQARGMVMALAPCSSDRAWGLEPGAWGLGPGACWWTCRSTATSNSGTWPRHWSPRRTTRRSRHPYNRNCAGRCGAFTATPPIRETRAHAVPPHAEPPQRTHLRRRPGHRRRVPPYRRPP